MKIKIANSFLSLIFMVTGCATSTYSTSLATAVEIPDEWNVVVRDNKDCPEIEGEFAIIPEVATLQTDGTWEFSKGNWYDFALLFPLHESDYQVKNSLEDDNGEILVISSNLQDGKIEIIRPVKNPRNVVTTILEKSEAHFECLDGSIVFPDFVIHGGTDGATLDGRIERSATLTLGNDLLVYELIHSRNQSHKYFLFQNLVNENSVSKF